MIEYPELILKTEFRSPRADQARVALLIETSAVYGRGILAGIAKHIGENSHWSVFLEQSALDAELPPWLGARAWDGVICRSTRPELVGELRSLAVPVVDLNDLHSDLGFPRIVSDHRAIGAMGADYFIRKGYRRFGFCGEAGRLWSMERYEGYRDSVLRAGGTFSAIEPAAGADLPRIMAWLGSFEPPAAIMACNDAVGCRILEACARLGIDTPADMAVIGVDDERLFCELCSPSLSSLRPNTELIGHLAAATLESLMSGSARAPSSAEAVLVPPVGIVERRSTDASAIEDPVVSTAIRFIRDRAAVGCTVDEVLAAVSSSRSVLERKFRKCVGRSPQEEIWAVRIGRIKELLRDTDLKLPTIAELCGIEHPEYLSVAFKRETGMTPGEYRARTRIA
jgi:LacI family transcriptional regulator